MIEGYSRSRVTSSQSWTFETSVLLFFLVSFDILPCALKSECARKGILPILDRKQAWEPFFFAYFSVAVCLQHFRRRVSLKKHSANLPAKMCPFIVIVHGARLVLCTIPSLLQCLRAVASRSRLRNIGKGRFAKLLCFFCAFRLCIRRSPTENARQRHITIIHPNTDTT